MALSSAGPSRSSSSRQVERTLSNSSLGNVMQASGVRVKGKAEAMELDDDDDDVIVLGSWERPTASNIKSQARSIGSTARSSTEGSRTACTSQTSVRGSASATQTVSSSLKNSSSTQRKRKAALPGDGFKMDFQHSRRPAMVSGTGLASSSSTNDRPSRREGLSPHPSLPPHLDTLGNPHHPTAQPTPSYTSMISSSLAGPTQSKSKPLRAIPRPPPFAIAADPSPPPLRKKKAVVSSTRETIEARPPPAKIPSQPTTSPDFSPPSLPPSLPPPPSPRKRSLPASRSPRTQHLLSTTDWSSLHPSLVASHLFRLEYVQHGGLTYSQSRGAAAGFGKASAPRPSVTVVKQPDPSWIKDEQAVAELKTKLGEREHFVALLWTRDVLGRNKMVDGSVSKAGELRKAVVGGVDMWLLGKEFPLKFVMIVGVVVGIITKDDFVIYEVDDGTGVLNCRCSLAKPVPTFLPQKRDLHPNGMPKTPSPRKRKAEVVEEVGEDQLAVGMLVRLVGSVEEHGWIWDADRVISVEKIESLQDLNLEAEHHLQVAQLHREVYSQPFDLNDRLSKIKREEVDRWAHLPSSQASSSTAGTPKKIHFRRPAKLDDEDITPQNFVTYIRQHLRDHHVDYIAPPPSQSTLSAPSSQADNGLWQMRLSQHDTEASIVERPTPFTLDDLESDRHLQLFATRLAQKHEREKRLKRKGRPTKKSEVWVKKQGRDGQPVSLKGVGSHGGSSLLLPTISSGARTSKRVKTDDKVDAEPLSGERLEMAISKRFREALIEMRRKGAIVVNVPEAEGHRWGMDERGEEEDILLDLPSYRPSNKKTSCAAQDPWAFQVEVVEEEPRKASTTTLLDFTLSSPQLSAVSPSKITTTRAAAGDEAWLFQVDMDDDGPSTKTESRARGTLADFALNSDDVEPLIKTSTSLVPLGISTTPRKRSAASHPASSPTTVKPNRTCKLAVDQQASTTLGDSPSQKAESSSPPTSSTRSAAASFDRTFLTDSSWSDSVDAVEEETFELVTYTSVSIPVHRALKHLYNATKGTAKGKKADRGVTEREVREALLNDEQWEQVARYSEQVGKALKVLKEIGEVESVGVDKWIPLTGLGFGKGGINLFD